MQAATHDPSPRLIRTPANKRSRQNTSAESISGGSGCMSKPQNSGFSTLTYEQSQSQSCRCSHQCQTGQLNRETWPNRCAVYVKLSVSGNLINFMEAKTAQITAKADNQLVSSSPETSPWMLVISIRHCPPTGSETTR